MQQFKQQRMLSQHGGVLQCRLEPVSCSNFKSLIRQNWVSAHIPAVSCMSARCLGSGQPLLVMTSSEVMFEFQSRCQPCMTCGTSMPWLFVRLLVCLVVVLCFSPTSATSAPLLAHQDINVSILLGICLALALQRNLVLKSFRVLSGIPGVAAA